ncbi:hypothetical protein DRW07_15605 [Alteromonas sediminis]|uniref:MSHA biogenesis protein MshF n=1 Tax=Alteromonas sediminis TaxID=2259342 RepID=A0A3N5Y540_9ALTE|nr:hypothetical protein [Alteromonas sediminis]RPJ65329.1 hypothetical protein DRW07_15605 [Alteromonas sediminis]
MSRQDVADNSNKALLINIVVVVLFVSLMGLFIKSYMESEPDLNAAVLEGFARQFETASSNAHWRWQASGRPERIMLLHFDAQGNEKDRSAVRMAHFGRPWVEQSSDGCAKLWLTLLNVPAMVNGFRVIAEYYPNRDDSQPEALGVCRYRLSRGAYFDYAIDTGDVTFHP